MPVRATRALIGFEIVDMRQYLSPKQIESAVGMSYEIIR